MNDITAKIAEIIDLYKADFERVDSEERYKWIAVKCFQDNWDLDAPDFHAMLEKAFEKRENLIGSAYYFPYKVLAEFARQEPETVRAMFAALYDEARLLDERIAEFQQAFEPFIRRQSKQFDTWKQSYQDLHAVSVYLAFRYPEKYYIYKLSIYRKLAAYVGYAAKRDKAEKYANYADLLDIVRGVLKNDGELTAMSRTRLEDDCYADNEYRMLTMDIAYFASRLVKPEIIDDEPPAPEIGVRYWLYAPGEKGVYWDEFRAMGIMAIGWGGLGDLNVYGSKSEIQATDEIQSKNKKKLKNFGKNIAHCCWQFAHDIKVGDIIIAKQGLHKIIGRGEVIGSYRYDPAQTVGGDCFNIIDVNWTHTGSWDYPNSSGQAPLKTLTDITPYTETVQKIEAYFAELEELSDLPERTQPEPLRSSKPEKYGAAEFLDDVFMGRKQYDTLVGLLRHHKNLILQGAPGVGKTYAAIKLAWAIMGEKDDDRIRLVQFHQSYSYEDFIKGYRPEKDGFKLTEGAFYSFCKDAQEDDENDYFFIIDEINRGNLSKIFGELLMLIENDKRGETVRLLYENEQFAVPKNLYIIGMMNTADRGLALLDYALRRRFGFFDMEPAFDAESFREHQDEVDNPKFDALVEAVCDLNIEIAADSLLGKGFRIGHSYFCGKTYDDERLNAIVEYNLVPLLAEYWVDEPDKAMRWAETLRGAISDEH
ncbi:hypothetical protein FACS189490_05950 [Clostridia bacterium]|nr:hypothetical protein FACS189490_05950 [Clostridia bacterium]